MPLGAYVSAPSTAEEMDASIRYMLASNTNVLELQYPSLTMASARQVMEAALSAVKVYCEQCYNTVSCSYSSDGAIVLTFSAADAGDQILAYRDAGHGGGHRRPRPDVESGAITPSMTDYEKALVYYTWICDNCVYDYTAGDGSLSISPTICSKTAPPCAMGTPAPTTCCSSWRASTAPPSPTAPTSGPWPSWTERSTTSTPPGATAVRRLTTATSP